MNRKCSYFTSMTGTKNTNLEITAVQMSVAEYAIIKSTGRFSTPVEFWWCTNSPQISYEQVSHLQKMPQTEGPGRC